MNIHELLPMFEKFGVGGIISFVFIFIIYSTFGNKTVIDHIFGFIGKLFTKNNIKVGKITESDITNHDLFSFIDLWTYSKIPTLTFPSEFKTVVFRRYLQLYLSKHKSVIQEYIKSGNYKTMDDSELWKSVINLVNSIIYEYEREMLLIGLPPLVIEKMKSNNNDTIVLMIELIEGICTSSFYHTDNNYLKVYSILNIVLPILQHTINNSEKICASINGHLKGQTFAKDGVVYKEL